MAWLAIESVTNGLSNANGEILGGVWTLLVTWAAWQAKGLPKGLNYLGLVVGVVGLVSAIPGLNDMTGLFGMSQMLWFIWLGIVLLRWKPSAAAEADVRRQDDARRASGRQRRLEFDQVNSTVRPKTETAKLARHRRTAARARSASGRGYLTGMVSSR